MLDKRPWEMTEKGRQFTLESRRKAAFEGKRKFNQTSSVWKTSLQVKKPPQAIKSELQALKVLVENTSQELVDCLNLATDTEDEVQLPANNKFYMSHGREFVPKHSSSGLFGFERQNEIKLGRSSRSNFSQRSAKSNSCCKDALLGATVQRAVTLFWPSPCQAKDSIGT